MDDVCKHGHVNPSRRSNGNCVSCEKERYAKSAAKRKQTREASRKRYNCPVRGPKHKAYMKEYVKKNRDKLTKQARERQTPESRIKARLRRLGLSLDLLPVILNHSGKCDICQGNPTDRWNTLHIDHCHNTGRYRGMLCGKCNKGLGLFNDNTETLQKARMYLQQSASETHSE